MDTDTCKAAIKAAYKAQQQQQKSDTTTTQLASDIVDAIVALIESGNVNFSVDWLMEHVEEQEIL